MPTTATARPDYKRRGANRPVTRGREAPERRQRHDNTAGRAPVRVCASARAAGGGGARAGGRARPSSRGTHASVVGRPSVRACTHPCQNLGFHVPTFRNHHCEDDEVVVVTGRRLYPPAPLHRLGGAAPAALGIAAREARGEAAVSGRHSLAFGAGRRPVIEGARRAHGETNKSVRSLSECSTVRIAPG